MKIILKRIAAFSLGPALVFGVTWLFGADYTHRGYELGMATLVSIALGIAFSAYPFEGNWK